MSAHFVKILDMSTEKIVAEFKQHPREETDRSPPLALPPFVSSICDFVGTFPILILANLGRRFFMFPSRRATTSRLRKQGLFLPDGHDSPPISSAFIPFLQQYQRFYRFCACLRRSIRFSISPSLGAKRSEEHTSELQSLMRISYAVFC